MSDIFDLAVDLVRAQAAAMGVRDNPNRVAPPEYESAPPDFSELSMSSQLDIAETVCRREPFFSALDEALVESDKYRSFMHMVLDSCVPNAEVGRMAREIVLEYLQRVAVAHSQNLGDFA